MTKIKEIGFGLVPPTTINQEMTTFQKIIPEKTMTPQKTIPKKTRCIAIVDDTGKRCKAQAVAPNTFRTKLVKDPATGKKKKVRTSIVNDPTMCQMHQRDRVHKCRCNCHKKIYTIYDEEFQNNKLIEDLNEVFYNNELITDQTKKIENVKIKITPEQSRQLLSGDTLDLSKTQMKYLKNAFGTSNSKPKKPKKKPKTKSKSKSKTKS